MTVAIPARPTVYEGIPMRSRMEARMAAYFDRLGWPWEYEPRAYASGGTQYLPDFEIRPSVGGPSVYLDVKGAHPTLGQLDALLRRILVIRASEPAAWLAVCSDATIAHGRFGLCAPDSEQWHERYVMGCPDHPQRVEFHLLRGDDMVAPWCVPCDPDRTVLVKWWDAMDYVVGDSYR